MKPLTEKQKRHLKALAHPLNPIIIVGGAGVTEDFGLARTWASMRTLRLADGPDEVHRRAIARIELRKQAERAGIGR